MIGFLLASGALAISLGDCAVLPAETALDRFEEMLVSGSAAAEVGFADCLAELNLLHSAQRHYLQVVRSGSRDDAWHAAVDRAMALVDHTGDPHSVQPYIQGIDAREVRTEHGHDALFYVHANNLIAEGQHELAAVRLENVDPRSPWGPAAIYAQARAIDATGRVDPALDLYGKVHEAPLEVDRDEPAVCDPGQ